MFYSQKKNIIMSKSVRTYGMTISSMYHDVISSDGDLVSIFVLVFWVWFIKIFFLKEGLIIGSVKKKIDNIIEDEVEKELVSICIGNIIETILLF